MEILRNEYKVTKSNDSFQARYDIYDIEKTITYDNGEIETRTRVFIPFRDGDINKVNFDDLYFSPSISQEEWKQLPEEYNKAWFKGTFTQSMCEEVERLVMLIRENKRKRGMNYIYGK